MNKLPDRANLAHLKKQAKDLIRLYRDGNPEAIARFREALPAAAGRSDAEIVALGLRLHDAQSCVARSYDFASWRTFAAMSKSNQRPAMIMQPACCIGSGSCIRAMSTDEGSIAPIPASLLGCWWKAPMSRWAVPIWHVQSAMKTRCGRRPGPIRPGSIDRAGRCACRRSSPSRTQVCARCSRFANACIGARDVCSRPAPIQTSGLGCVGRRRR